MNTKKLIKVCGMREGDNIRQVEELNVDFIGMIFYPGSPRFVGQIPEYLPETSKRVGVFVNESYENISETARRYSLDCIQLHGSESPALCVKLREDGYKVMKAFLISEPDDLLPVSEFEGVCDYYIFDTKCNGHGGSGKQFDWSILDAYQGKTPFLLSGGLGLHNLQQALLFKHECLAGYDLNSRFEDNVARKNVEALRQFIQEIK